MSSAQWASPSTRRRGSGTTPWWERDAVPWWTPGGKQVTRIPQPPAVRLFPAIGQAFLLRLGARTTEGLIFFQSNGFLDPFLEERFHFGPFYSDKRVRLPKGRGRGGESFGASNDNAGLLSVSLAFALCHGYGRPANAASSQTWIRLGSLDG